MEKGLNEIKREKYIQLSRLLLDKRSSEPRDEVHNILVEIGLFSNMKLKEWLTLTEIQESISYEIGIESYPIEPLKRSISRLVHEKRIKVKEAKEGQDETLYSLEKDRKEQLQKYKKDADDLYNKIIDELVEEIKRDIGELNKKDIDTICEVFDLTLSSVFTAMENVSTVILTGEDKKTKEIMIDISSEFRKHLRRIDEPALRKSLSTNIRKMILNPSQEMKRYFLLSANTSFIIRLLNLDPECQTLEKSIFSNIVLYLDTNIIISALYPTHELHAITCEVLKESAKLGVQLKITSRTLKELDNVITRANDIYSKSQTPTKSKFYIPENTIIETFVRYAETKGDTWETFLSACKKQRTVLEKKYNVQVDNTDYKEVIDKDKLNELSKIAKECSQQRLFPKSDEVAEHDGYHFAVIDYLRETNNTSHNIWFLSHDRTFDCVNRGYFKLEQKSLPCSLMCSSWLEVLFPFLSPEVSEERFEDIFLKIMGSDFFSMTKSLSFGNLARFFAPFYGDEYLDEGDYISILQDQLLNRILKDWKESDYSSEYDVQLAETIAKLVDKRKNERLKKMSKELESKEKRIKELDKQLAITKTQIKSTQIETKTKVKELDAKLSKLEANLKTETEKRIRNRRYGEFFIGILVALLVGLLLILGEIKDGPTVFGIIVGGIAIGSLFIRIYHWLTK